MDYKKLGYGIIIWAVIYLVAVGFVAYKIIDTFWAKGIIVIVATLLALWMGMKLNQPSIGAVLMYTASWVVIGFILDLILTVPFAGWSIFYAWDYWLGNTLVLLLPLLTNKKPKTVVVT